MGIPWSISDYRNSPPQSVPGNGLPLHTLRFWSLDGSSASAKAFGDGPKKSAELSFGLTDDASSSFSLKTTSAAATFASLVVEIPRHIRENFSTAHIMRMDTTLHQNMSVATYARLNLQHGPDTDAIPRQIPNPSGQCVVEFDLSTTLIGVRPVKHMWMDLIFERPGVGQIGIANLTLSIRPRAQF